MRLLGLHRSHQSPVIATTYAQSYARSLIDIIADIYEPEDATILFAKLCEEIELLHVKLYPNPLPRPGESGWHVTHEASSTGERITDYRFDLLEWCAVHGQRLVVDELRASLDEARAQYQQQVARFERACDRHEQLKRAAYEGERTHACAS